MRSAPALLLFLFSLPGCSPPGNDHSAPAAEKTARVLAGLIETAARNREAALDPLRSSAAADSVLKSESMTREEFRRAVGALNRDVRNWRAVSEEASRILEGRLAARSRAR